MDLGLVLKQLFDIIIELGEYSAALWGFMTKPILIGFELPIVGSVGFTIVPIYAIGAGGILTIITLWLVKELVPVA